MYFPFWLSQCRSPLVIYKSLNVTWVRIQVLCYQRQKNSCGVFSHTNDMANHEERQRIIGLYKVNLCMTRFRRWFGEHCSESAMETWSDEIRYTHIHTYTRDVTLVIVLTSHQFVFNESSAKIGEIKPYELVLFLLSLAATVLESQCSGNWFFPSLTLNRVGENILYT